MSMTQGPRWAPWAMMTEISWQLYGTGVLGYGHGQRYTRNETGDLMQTSMGDYND